jgi:two-component system, sensor histidine kinase YesM
MVTIHSIINGGIIMLISAFNIPKNSIRFKLVVGLLTVMLPVIAFLIYNNFYAIKVVHNQVAESYKNMMSLYMNQIDSNLDAVDTYLINLQASETDLQIMLYSKNEEKYSLAKMRLSNKIKNDIAMYKSIDSIFIYSISKQDFVGSGDGAYSYNEARGIREFIADSCSELQELKKPQIPNWYVKKLGKEYYLIRILKMGDIYVGSWASVKRLLVPLEMINIGQNGTSLLASEQGEPMMNEQLVLDNSLNLNLDFNEYHLIGNKNRYLFVGEKSLKGNFSLIALVPDNEILQKLPYFQSIITIISALLILLLPVSLLLLRRIIIVPLRKMLTAMKRIQEGDLEARIEPYATSEEFKVVNKTFNKMMGQIQDLKINVYEEKINRQKAELQHLQLQINPHFFLNSLNIIHALASTRKFDLIQEMTLCLIKYFRYMFKSNLSFLPLKDELQHVQNYIRIQELRFSECLSYNLEVPDYLLDTMVPPLIIHTFIENSIKYAVSMDEQVHLSVSIQLVNSDEGEHFFKIQIKDTGEGFKEEVLTELLAGNRIVDEHGEHIGIWNVQRRLSLLYKGRAYLCVGNAESGGAVVEITLPLNIDNLDLED